jgi:hypothetical protein
MAINIPIVSEFDDKGLKLANKALGDFGAGANKGFSGLTKSTLIAGAAIAGAAVAVGAFAYSAIQSASNFNEAISKNTVVFGAISKEIENFARTANTALGLSETAALAAAGTFAIFGKSAGLAGKDLADFATELVTLAADLASFSNTSVDDAINALGSALRGEAEPLRKYGVLLNDATLKAAAMELGIYKGSGALTAQQKVLAAQKVIYDQTSDAQGDFARTSDGLAAQQKILGATFDDIQQKLGKAFLPIFLDVVTFLNDNVMPAFERVAEVIGEKGLVKGLQQAVHEMGSSGPALVNGFKTIAVNAAKMANIVFKSVQLLIANFQFLTGHPLDAIKTASKAFNNFIDIDKLEASFTSFNAGVTNMASASGYSSFAAKKLAEDAKAAADMAELLGDNAGGKGGSGGGTSKKLKEMADRIKEAAAALNKEMAEALDGAKDRLKKAQDEFDNFSQSVSTVVKGALDFGKAFEERGEDAGLTFFSALQKQADKAKEFAGLVEQLLAAGLSQEALQQVIDAGIDSGAAIAKELLQSSGNVLRANTLVAETNAIAERIGELSASKFYAAGVSNAQQYLAGVEAAMAVAKTRLAAKGIKLPEIKNIGANFNETITTPIATSPVVDLLTVRGGTGASGAVTINVNGGISTGPVIAKAVYNAMLEYKQYYGPLTALAE